MSEWVKNTPNPSSVYKQTSWAPRHGPVAIVRSRWRQREPSDHWAGSADLWGPLTPPRVCSPPAFVMAL
jgi:hypothetical protein